MSIQDQQRKVARAGNAPRRLDPLTMLLIPILSPLDQTRRIVQHNLHVALLKVPHLRAKGSVGLAGRR